MLIGIEVYSVPSFVLGPGITDDMVLPLKASKSTEKYTTKD